MNGFNGKCGAKGIQNIFKQKWKRHGPRLPFEMGRAKSLLCKGMFFSPVVKTTKAPQGLCFHRAAF